MTLGNIWCRPASA